MRSRYLPYMDTVQDRLEMLQSSGAPEAAAMQESVAQENRNPAPNPAIRLPQEPESTAPQQATSPAPAPSPATSTAPEVVGAVSENQVKLGLRRVKDPDLQLNILDLGLVYGVRVDGAVVSVDMTLTSPGCPSGPEIMGDAERELRALPGVEDVKINLVWAPFWTPDRIEPRVRAYLGL